MGATLCPSQIPGSTKLRHCDLRSVSVIGDRRVIALAIVLTFMSSATAEDEIEFLSGAKLKGRVTKIDKQSKLVTFESNIGTRTRRRDYPYNKIHAVTYRNKRYVLTPKASNVPEPNGDVQTDKLSRDEVLKLINTVGPTPPSWYDSARLNYPRTLDLSWPNALSSQWNTQKNVSHFVWSVINENPGRWRDGVKFLHHVLKVNDNNPSAQRKAMIELGEKYHNLFQDYARAAYWYRRAEVDENPPRGNPGAPVRLAECYWRLGSKQMADELLNNLPFRFESIKLWADMRELKKSLQVADAAIKSRDPYTVGRACVYAGDGCRTAGQLSQALNYYKKTLNLTTSNNRIAKRIQRIQNRARASITAIQLFDQSDVNGVADGTYRSNSLGYEGAVHVEVVVNAQRIESVRVTQHREKQFYAALTDTPKKIIAKQGVKGVDTTSRATITSEAIINASAKALAGK